MTRSCNYCGCQKFRWTSVEFPIGINHDTVLVEHVCDVCCKCDEPHVSLRETDEIIEKATSIHKNRKEEF